MLMRFSHSVALSSQTIAMSHDRFAPKTEFVFRAFRICHSLLEVVKDKNSRKLKCRMYHVQINRTAYHELLLRLVKHGHRSSEILIFFVIERVPSPT